MKSSQHLVWTVVGDQSGYKWMLQGFLRKGKWDGPECILKRVQFGGGCPTVPTWTSSFHFQDWFVHLSCTRRMWFASWDIVHRREPTASQKLWELFERDFQIYCWIKKVFDGNPFDAKRRNGELGVLWRNALAAWAQLRFYKATPVDGVCLFLTVDFVAL